jgi:hypothetical protein
LENGRRNIGTLSDEKGLMKSSPSQNADVRLDAGQPTKQMPPLRVSGLTKTEAEELLDWLENQGVEGSQLVFVDGQGFTVWHD